MDPTSIVERVPVRPYRAAQVGTVRTVLEGQWRLVEIRGRPCIRFVGPEATVDPLAAILLAEQGILTSHTQIFTAGRLLGLAATDVQVLVGATDLSYMRGLEGPTFHMRAALLDRLNLTEGANAWQPSPSGASAINATAPSPGQPPTHQAKSLPAPAETSVDRVKGSMRAPWNSSRSRKQGRITARAVKQPRRDRTPQLPGQ